MADFWFGNLRRAGYFPAPNSGMDADSIGVSDQMEFANGGAYVAQSAGTHREFNLSWGVQEKSVMNFLKDYRNGVHGSGLLYMVDPFAANALPPHWANPGLTCEGWPSLVSPSVKPVRAGATTVTNLATNPAFVAGGAPIVTRTNFVPVNPSMKNSVTGWATAGATTRTATPNGLQVDFTGSVAGGVSFLYTEGTLPSAAPGEVWSAGMDVSVPVGFPAASIKALIWDGVTFFEGPPKTIAPGATERIIVEGVVIGATGTRARLTLRTSGTHNTGTRILLSNAMLERFATTGDYFDGSTPAKGDYTHAWVGATDASYSTQSAPAVVTASVNSQQVSAHRMVAPDTRSGYAARFVLVSAANMGINFVVTPTGLTGQLMTIIMRVRASRNISVRPRIYINQTTQGNVVLPANQWVTIRGTAVVPTASDIYTGLLITSTSGHLVGDTIDIDHMLVAVGDYNGPFFDGSTEFLDGTKGAWTGVPDASTSTLARTPGGMPNTGAQYTLTGEVGVIPQRKLQLLVPQDRDLWFGFSGVATNGGVLRMRGITRDGAYGPVSDVPLLDPSGSVRLNTKVSGTQYSAIQVYMTTTVPGTATITLVSGKAVYSLQSDSPVLTGDHVEGDGHTGFRLGDISTAYIQAADGHQYVTTATKATEIEAWI